MDEITIIGLDLAKRVFQAHGAYRDGNTAFPQKAQPFTVGAVPCRAASMHRCDGSLCKRPFLGTGRQGTRTRSSVDPAHLREALCETAEE